MMVTPNTRAALRKAVVAHMELADVPLKNRRDAAVDALDAELIRAALTRCYGNQVKAAQLLGQSRNWLRYRANQLGVVVTATGGV